MKRFTYLFLCSFFISIIGVIVSCSDSLPSSNFEVVTSSSSEVASSSSSIVSSSSSVAPSSSSREVSSSFSVTCNVDNLQASYVSGSEVPRPNVSCGTEVTVGTTFLFNLSGSPNALDGWNSDGTHAFWTPGKKDITLSEVTCDGNKITLDPAISCGSFEVVAASSSSIEAVVPSNVFGDNPIVQTAFTADPAPVVFKDSRYSDRLFVYTSNDAPNADWFDMSNLMCYSTTDMVNWTAHGAVMSDVDFTWAKAKTFWASQVIDRNNKFYAYVPIEKGTGGGPQIGVGVSDSPYGPFKDALGKPLISGNWAGDIDPTVFIDDNGQAYLYWGNPKLKYAKLKSNMTELDGSVVEVPMTVTSFGARSGEADKDRPTSYEEGPWFYKRNVSGLANPYYLVYAGGPISEHLAYATAPTATGPWTYGGIIMPSSNGLAFTNHPGVIDYKGKSYLFYHDQRLNALEGHTGGFTRSVSVAEFTYGSNGSIPRVSASVTGPAAIAVLNPYNKTSATTINYSSKVKASRKNANDKNALEMIVNDVRSDGYIRIKAVDFGSVGATSFIANIACGTTNTKIEIRAGGTNSTNGKLLGTMNVANNGWNTWREQTVNLERVTGIQDVYLVFKGSGSSELLRMEYWRFL